MSRNPTTSKIIDEILLFGVTGTALAGGLLAPNLLIALDKPLRKFWKHLDQREKERELQRVIYGMKAHGYLAGEYEHGLQLTQKAKDRLLQIEFDSLAVEPQSVWDKQWRIVIYDIPEARKAARNALTEKLRIYGCFQLQKSTWITPFPCRKDIAAIAANYDVDSYVTYFEATNLDNAAPLIKRFQKKYPHTKFS